MKKHVCPKCGGTKFTTTAHVMQEWKVDGLGNFLEVTEDCLEVTHKPDDSNCWFCTECGTEAIIIDK